MRKQILFLFGILCSIPSLVSCQSLHEKMAIYSIQPDSAVYCNLGKTVSDVLFSPKKVTCYTIKGKATVEKGDCELEPHYVRDSLVAKLNDEEIGILQFTLLADEENYGQDSVKVRSPYVPCIELCFEKKKQVAHVIVSLSNFSWTIMYDDKKLGNWNYSNKRLMERYCKMLLGDALDKIR